MAPKLDTIYDNDVHQRISALDSTLTFAPEHFGTRRIGLAIAGVGRMGSIHLFNAVCEPRANLLYIVDESQERLDFMRKKYYLDERGVKALTTDKWNEVLNDKRVEAVLVSTPTKTHEAYTMSALKFGKHVLSEKPLAAELASVKQITTFAKAKNLTLICAFNRRYDPSFRRVKEQVARGDIGPIRVIKTCSRDSPLPPVEYIRTSSGIFHDCCVHDIDLTLWLAEELPCEVHAYGFAHMPDYAAVPDFDTVVLTMRFPSGLLSMTDLSRVSATGYEQRVEVLGPKGVLKIDDAPKGFWEKHTEVGVTRPNQCYSFASRYERAYANEIKELFNHIEGHKTMEPKQSEKYLPALCKIIDALEHSAKNATAVKLDWSADEQCF